MNIMDYITQTLSLPELSKIEKMIKNERLYNKETNPQLRGGQGFSTAAHPDSKHHKHNKSEVLSIDALYRMFKESMDEGPNVSIN